MDTHYTIGDFTFDTFHEYRDAQEDIRKIEAINSRLDIHEPETAVRLYNMIRNGDIDPMIIVTPTFNKVSADTLSG